MAETKFTPGPWKFDELMRDSLGMGYIRPEEWDGHEISHHGDMNRPEEENRANGHLQAAAPEMYDALKEALYVMGGSNDPFDAERWSKAVEGVQAALAKARGEAPNA